MEDANGEFVAVVQPEGEIEVDTLTLPDAVPGYDVATAVLEKVVVAQVEGEELKQSVGDTLTVPVAASEVAMGDPDLVTDTVGELDTLKDTVNVPDKVAVVEWVTEEHTEGDKLGVTVPEAAFEVATGDPEPEVHTVGVCVTLTLMVREEVGV